MVTSRPSQSNWLANNALTIVLAIIAAQQAYSAINNDIGQRLSRLEERLSAVMTGITESRARRDVQIEGLNGRLLAVERRR